MQLHRVLSNMQRTRQKDERADRKGVSNDSPENPERKLTLDTGVSTFGGRTNE